VHQRNINVVISHLLKWYNVYLQQSLTHCKREEKKDWKKKILGLL